MSIVTRITAPPDLPPQWKWEHMTHHDWCVWARAYGEKYADLCAIEDRQNGLRPSLTAAARKSRAAYGARRALHYGLDARALVV
jgi:hypothetical protein